MSRGEIDELAAEPVTSYPFLNTDADEFVTGEYQELKKSIVDNSYRLPDLMIEGDLIFKRTKFCPGGKSLEVVGSHWTYRNINRELT